MDKALGDKIPEFNRKKAAGGNVGITGASFSLGDHRTKFEVLVIALVAVLIIGGGEFLLYAFKVPHYVLPRPSQIVTALYTEFPFYWPHLLTTLFEMFVGFAIGGAIGFVLAAVITQFPFVEKIVTPYILLLVTTPMLALVPLLILRFGFGNEVQPRLGLSYRLREAAGDKMYASWGRFYNMDQKSSGRSLAPSRIYQTQTVFDLNGVVLSSGPLASTTGKMIDPDIKPIYSDEILAGYATPIAGAWSLDVFALFRTMNNFIEDVPSRQNGTAPDSGPFVATNLPCARFAACQGANAERTYRAVTLDLRRRLRNGWSADVSYMWSRFEGNFDLDYSSVLTSTTVFNTSSFIQDGPGTNVQDPYRNGPLFEDRPHVVKAFASYDVTSRLTASGFMRVQSGTPWAARGRDWEGAVLNYLEPAGSHRNPVWANLDLMATYRVPLGGRTNLQVEARLLNVFDNQTRLSTDAQQYLDLRTIQTPPYFGLPWTTGAIIGRPWPRVPPATPVPVAVAFAPPLSPVLFG